MPLLRLGLALVALCIIGLPTAAQVLGVPRSFVPTICSGATGVAAVVCLNDGNNQTLPWLKIDPGAHTLSHIGDGSPLTVALPDGSTPSLKTILSRTLIAPLPDSVEGYYTVTTVAGSPNVKIVGANLTSANVNQMMTVYGAGPNEWRLIGKVIAVTDPTDVVLSASATQSMTAIVQKVEYGSDQYAVLQPLADLARSLNFDLEIKTGNYLLSQGLNCSPPNNSHAFANAFAIPPALCRLDQGARLVAMAPMAAVITYGGKATDFSQFIHSAIVGGGTIDGNFIATDCVEIPFYEVVVRREQNTKNCMRAGVKYGDLSSPTDSGGSLDLDNANTRDAAYVTITGISNTNPAVVTCSWDCGVATGRIITPIGIVGPMTVYLNLKFFEVTPIDARHFSLNNTDATKWGSFTSGRFAMTMPSMHVLHLLRGVTNANPAVFSTDVHHFTNGQKVFVSDAGSMPTVSGIFTVAGCTPTTCQLSGLDTTNAPAFTGGGTVLTWDDPTTTQIYALTENAPDSDFSHVRMSGVRFGILGGSASGYDGKVEVAHGYNDDENGAAFDFYDLAGKYTLTAVQCDAPVHFCYRFTGGHNMLTGGRMTYQGRVALNNNMDSFIRIEPGAGVNVFGGGEEGQAGSNILNTVSGDTSQYGQIGLDWRYVSHLQPDTINNGNLVITNKNGGNASLSVKGPNNTTSFVCDTTTGHNGIYWSTTTGGTNLAVTDNNCKYVSTAATIKPNAFSILQPLIPTLQTSCTGLASGTLYKDTMTSPATVKVCP